MLIQKTGTNRYLQGEVMVSVTRTNGQAQDYSIRIAGDELLDLDEDCMSDLLDALETMVENGDIKKGTRTK